MASDSRRKGCPHEPYPLRSPTAACGPPSTALVKVPDVFPFPLSLNRHQSSDPDRPYRLCSLLVMSECWAQNVTQRSRRLSSFLALNCNEPLNLLAIPISLDKTIHSPLLENACLIEPFEMPVFGKSKPGKRQQLCKVQCNTAEAPHSPIAAPRASPVPHREGLGSFFRVVIEPSDTASSCQNRTLSSTHTQLSSRPDSAAEVVPLLLGHPVRLSSALCPPPRRRDLTEG